MASIDDSKDPIPRLPDPASYHLMAGPSPTSNWVVPQRLLISGNPGLERKHMKALIVDTKCKLIVNLQEDKELHGDEDYIDVLDTTCKQFEVPCPQIIRFPVKDGFVGDLKEVEALIATLVQYVRSGSTVMVHCHGGHGRAGQLNI